jgi:hypothetical protein
MSPRQPLQARVLATVAGCALLALAVVASLLRLRAGDPAVLGLRRKNSVDRLPFADTEAGCRISAGSAQDQSAGVPIGRMPAARCRLQTATIEHGDLAAVTAGRGSPLIAALHDG